MIDLSVIGEGRVRIASLTVLNESGVDDCVGLQFEANAEDGWLVLSQEKALELAARLMVYAGGSE